MVPEGETSYVDLVHDPGHGVKSSNPNIASIAKSPSGSSQFRTEYHITGKSAGQTFIQVAGSPVRLDVRVKIKLSYEVAFFFIKNPIYGRSRRDPRIASAVVGHLNSIYSKQTNVEFRLGGVQTDVEVGTDMDTILYEKRHGPHDRRKPSVLYKLHLDLDGASDINVVFMPWDGTRSTDSPAVITEKYGPCVISDEMADGFVLPALGHGVGRALGCDETADDRRELHLMFWERAEGLGGATGDFLPKVDVQVLNPDYGGGW